MVMALMGMVGRNASGEMVLCAEWDGTRVVFRSDDPEMQARIAGWQRDGLFVTGDDGWTRRTLVTDPEFLPRLVNHLAREVDLDARVPHLSAPPRIRRPRNLRWALGCAVAGALAVHLLLWAIRSL